jgi:hypothetical protein
VRLLGGRSAKRCHPIEELGDAPFLGWVKKINTSVEIR